MAKFLLLALLSLLVVFGRIYYKTYQIKILLKAFSFEHDPHIMVVILFNPFGAIFNNIDWSFSGHSLPGNTPNAGLLIRAKIIIIIRIK